MVAVGTLIAERPPHRSRRVLLTHRAALPKQMSTGDRTILGKISKRGNRYLRVLFVQAAWVVLVKPMSWERHGLKHWIEAAWLSKLCGMTLMWLLKKYGSLRGLPPIPIASFLQSRVEVR